MNRRELLERLGAGGAVPLLASRGAASTGGVRQEFATDDWRGWAKDGVSNLRLTDDAGILEAATDIYPSDRRAAVFRTDTRSTDAEVRATITDQGVGPGLVLRRVGPETYYAAVFEREAGSLELLARVDGVERVLARRPVGIAAGDRIELSFRALGTDPTTLQAGIAPGGSPEAVRVRTTDATDALQRSGDPGVLGTAETGFRAGPDWRTPLGTQSARAIWVTDQFEEGDEGGVRNSPVPVEEGRAAATGRTSTTAFESITIDAVDDAVATTRPSTVAATSLRPRSRTGGRDALVSVVCDVACEVAVEVAPDPSFDRSRTVAGGPVNEYETAFVEVPPPRPGERFFWRPRLERGDRESVGPVRSVRALPPAGSPGEVTLAIGSCATQFGETFETIADLDPDVFVWHGDLNYLDASGPLAQTESGYAGMWKDLLAVDELRAILDRSFFATQRDDHDYGKNDAAADTIPEYTIDPYEGIVNPDVYYEFGGGLVDVWVPETRRWRDPLSKPDTPDKTLLGEAQLEWLLDGLRASTAPFNVVCSPGPLFNVPNDSTSWAKGYTAERDRVLDVVEAEVEGRTVFVTGDTHSGCVTRFEDGDLDVLEVRAAPLDIPGPGQHDASSGETVEYSEQGKFVATIAVRGEGTEAVMDVALRTADGSSAWDDTLRVSR